MVFNAETYIFTSIEPVENLKQAILLTIDISHSKPNHKHIVLHHDSIAKLMHGIHGETT